MARLSTDDWCAIQEFWANYCWLVDEGEAEAWAALWHEDGVFTGVSPQPLAGRDSLIAFAQGVYAANGNGQLRHAAVNLTCEYGESRDTVKARFYNFVTLWGGLPGAGNRVMAICEAVLERAGDGWTLQSNTVRSLAP